eukprot:gene682-419_t
MPLVMKAAIGGACVVGSAAAGAMGMGAAQAEDPGKDKCKHCGEVLDCLECRHCHNCGGKGVNKCSAAEDEARREQERLQQMTICGHAPIEAPGWRPPQYYHVSEINQRGWVNGTNSFNGNNGTPCGNHGGGAPQQQYRPRSILLS